MDEEKTRVIALAGNPNVGKSTLFNALTGLHQHTGNWTGKTVTEAVGTVKWGEQECCLIDLPGTYSLYSRSEEERAARDFICFQNPDQVVVVVDAGNLARNLLLALPIGEVCKRVVLVVNLVDEASKKGISVNCTKLERLLGIPVIPAAVREGLGVEEIRQMLFSPLIDHPYLKIDYPGAEEILAPLEQFLIGEILSEKDSWNPRWLAVKFLENEKELIASIREKLDLVDEKWSRLKQEIEIAMEKMKQKGLSTSFFSDCILNRSQEIARLTVKKQNKKGKNFTDRLDKIFLGKYTALPCLFLFVTALFWLSAFFANYPSELLSLLFKKVGNILSSVLQDFPWYLKEPLLDGVYQVVSWVVAVMLPPMAIFFPLFTLAEDFGYLPRVAYLSDRAFCRAGVCGKQALTVCMGLGCNCTGIMGARIIDQKRERYIAILTNVFTPCNGRIPLLLTLIPLFFVSGRGILSKLQLAVCLLLFLLSSFLITVLVSAGLSKTVLRGKHTSFALELPPYRRPKIGQVLLRSVLDRTLLVLGRSVTAAAPAGLIIWMLSHFFVHGQTILSFLSGVLNPIGMMMGMDGAILLAFLLGLPANEIVLPILFMIYLGQGTLVDSTSVSQLGQLLTQNGWTVQTALCTCLFSICHFPCATAIRTIAKETGSYKWTAFSVFLPLMVGCCLCMIVSALFSLAFS